MHNTPLLVLGNGEIACLLVNLASQAGYKVTVADPDADKLQWPESVTIMTEGYAQTPWPIEYGTHAVIAQGHRNDAESLAALLNHKAERVYLIASAHRAQDVLIQARSWVKDLDRLQRLSAPAGLDLGGNSSIEIAISILAEIQLQRHHASGKILTRLRDERIHLSHTGQRYQECPGQRKMSMDAVLDPTIDPKLDPKRDQRADFSTSTH